MRASGIRNWHDEVHIGGALPRQDLSDLPPDLVDLASIQDGIGSCEVNPLEHAERLGVLSGCGIDLECVLGDLADLAGLDVPDDLTSQSVDGGALRDRYVSSIDLSETEGPEPVGVPDGEKPVLDQDGEGIGAIQLPHDATDGLHGVVVLVHVLAEKLDYEFTIGVREEGPALLHVLLLELGEIGYVAVVGDSHGAEIRCHREGLSVGDALRTCGGVPYVTYTDVSVEVLQVILVQSDIHQSVSLDSLDGTAVEDGYARALLPAVLDDHEGRVQS